MKSLHSFCTEHNLPKTSVRRWLNENGYGTSNGLSVAAIDAALNQFKPDAVEAAEVELIEPVGSEMVLHRPSVQGLVPIQIENLTINLTQANTRALEIETAYFQNVTAEGLSAIGQFIQADLTSTVQSAIAQNRHAIAGLNAQAVANLANSLGKPGPGAGGDGQS